jgi:hypothetical protein
VIAHAELGEELQCGAEVTDDEAVLRNADSFETCAREVQHLSVRRGARGANQLQANDGELA